MNILFLFLVVLSTANVSALSRDGLGHGHGGGDRNNNTADIHRARLMSTLQANCPSWATANSEVQTLLQYARNPRIPNPRKKASDAPLHVAFTVTQAMKDGRWSIGQLHNLQVVVLSLLFETPGPIVFHVVTTAPWFVLLENWFAELLHGQSVFEAVCFRLYCVDLDEISKVLASIDVTAPAGLYSRALLPEILPSSVDEVLYLDTDQFVVSDLRVLWQTPLQGHAIGITGSPPTNKDDATSACSCIMKLDLKELRMLNHQSAQGQGSASPWRTAVENTLKAFVEGKRLAGQSKPVHVPFIEKFVFSQVGNSFGKLFFIEEQWNVFMCENANRNWHSALARHKWFGAVHFNCMEQSLEYGKFGLITSDNTGSPKVISPEQRQTEASYFPIFSFYSLLPLHCLRSAPEHVLSLQERQAGISGLPDPMGTQTRPPHTQARGDDSSYCAREPVSKCAPQPLG